MNFISNTSRAFNNFILKTCFYGRIVFSRVIQCTHTPQCFEYLFSIPLYFIIATYGLLTCCNHSFIAMANVQVTSLDDLLLIGETGISSTDATNRRTDFLIEI